MSSAADVPAGIDEYMRECLAINVTGSLRSRRVVAVLARLVSRYGAALFLRAHNEPGFVSHAISTWMSQAGIATAWCDRRKPWQNRADQSFNSKPRDDCLSLEWYRSRKEDAVVVQAWRHHHNTVRPHGRLDSLTPHGFKQHNQTIPDRAARQE